MDINKIPSLDNVYTKEDEVKLLKDIIDTKKINVPRFSTGFDEFDEVMKGGFKTGDLVIISGRSGGGKTTLSQTITYNVCKAQQHVLWFSYEVSPEHLHQKFEEMGITEFYNVYAPQKNTTGHLKWIKDKIKEGWEKYNTKFVFIDHIDFLTPANNKTGDNEAISYKRIVTELKTLAIELDVVIILMAHIKKTEPNKDPEMEDIGYSAGIFQLADYVFMVWREQRQLQGRGVNKYTEETMGDLMTNRTVIKIVKNRETGQLKYLLCEYVNGKYIKYSAELSVDSIREIFGEAE